MRPIVRVLLSLLVLCITAAGARAQAAPAADGEMLAKQTAETGLKPGDMLGPNNAKLAEGLLPPEILKHYEKGEYVNRIIEWPLGQTKRDPEFLEATERNRGRFAVDEHGTIIDKATGKQPPTSLAFRFPTSMPRTPTPACRCCGTASMKGTTSATSMRRPSSTG